MQNLCLTTSTHQQKVTLIAAAGINNELGKDNAMLWHLPNDFKHFKALTSGHFIIMGRKTWESLPKALTNRTHLIITRNKDYSADNALIFPSIEAALAYAKDQERVFIIGGGQIYKLALAHATEIELTKVHGTFEADAFFPEIDLKYWKKIKSEAHQADDRHKFDYTFETYCKI